MTLAAGLVGLLSLVCFWIVITVYLVRSFKRRYHAAYLKSSIRLGLVRPTVKVTVRQRPKTRPKAQPRRPHPATRRATDDWRYRPDAPVGDSLDDPDTWEEDE